MNESVGLCFGQTGIDVREFPGDDGGSKVIQDARRSDRQAHHDAGIQNTTGSRRKLLDEGDNDRDP